MPNALKRPYEIRPASPKYTSCSEHEHDQAQGWLKTQEPHLSQALGFLLRSMDPAVAGGSKASGIPLKDDSGELAGIGR